MADKISILVQLNDADAQAKLKDLKKDLDVLEKKGANIKVTSTDVEKAQKETTALNQSLNDVQKTRSIHVSPGDLGSVGNAVSNLSHALDDLSRQHTININTNQLLGLPSAFQNSVRGYLNGVYDIGTQLPALQMLSASRYGVPVGQSYGNGFVFVNSPDYYQATAAFQQAAAMAAYAKGGFQAPAVWVDAMRNVGSMLPAVYQNYNPWTNYNPNFTMNGDPYSTYGAYGKQLPVPYIAPVLEGQWREVGETVEEVQSIMERPITPDMTGMNTMKETVFSISDVLTGIGGGFSTIGSALQGISNIFGIDLFDTVKRTLISSITDTATQGFNSAITRYDIMTTYADYMEIMGVSAEKADESLDKVNQAIQGIPVGLDTAAQEIRMFTMYLQGTGDSMDDVADKATNLTIGLERALVAGGASEAMKTTAKYEVNRLLATGSLSTKRQWQALLNGLGVSGQYLKDVMGYGGMSTQDFITKLTGSKDEPAEISTDQFLAGLAALADYEGLNKAIDIYKTTLEAGMYDIKFAVTRGFANTFMAIDETLEKETNKGIRDYIQDLRVGINELFADVQEWVKAHPEVLTTIMDKFFQVMEEFKRIGIGQLMLDIATQGGKMVDFFIKLIDVIPEGWLRQFATFAMVWAGPMGRLFSGLGGMFTTLGQLSGLLGKIPLIGRLFSMFSLFAPKGVTVSGVGGFAAMAGGLAGIAGVGGIIYEFAKVFESISKMQLGNNLESNLKKILPAIALIAGIITPLTMISSAFIGTYGINTLFGELAVGGIEIEIAAMGAIIYEFAKIGEEISKMDLSNYEENMKKIDGLIGWTTALLVGGVATAGGVAVASGGIGLIAEFAGVLVAGGILFELDKAASIIEKFANVSQTIADLDLPSDFDTKVTDFVNGVQMIFRAFPDLQPDDVNKSNDYKTYFENIGKAIEALPDTANAISLMEGRMNWLNRSEGKFDEIVGKVVEFSEGIGDIFDAFADAFGENGYVQLKASEKYPQILANMGTALDNLKQLASKMSIMERYFDEAQLGLEGDPNAHTPTTVVNRDGSTRSYVPKNQKTRFQTYVDRLKEMLRGVKEIMDIFGGDAEGEDWKWIQSVFAKWTTSNQAIAIGNIQIAFDSISKIITTISDTMEAVSLMAYQGKGGTSISRDGTIRSWDKASSIQKFVSNIKRVLNSLLSLFIDEDEEPIFAKFANIANAGDIAGVFSIIKEAFSFENGLKGILFNIRDSNIVLDEIIQNSIPSKIRWVLTQIGDAISSWAEEGFNDKLMGAQAFKDSAERIAAGIESLSSINDKINSMFKGDTDLGTQLSTIMGGLFGSFNTESAETFSAKAEELRTTLDSIVQMLNTLAQTDLTELVNVLGNIADTLQNRDVKQMDEFKKSTEKAADQARKLYVNLNEVKNAMSYSHSHFVTMVTDLSYLTSNLGIAAESARNLSDAISGIPRSVNVNYNETRIPFKRLINKPANAYDFFAGGIAPNGYDSIPAWLAPGEFVMRSRTVNTFGKDFMARVNALDIKGAMNALVKQYAFPNGAHVSNISNRDNHAVVNQYITTNNPNYSYARAGKFVRQL